MTTEELVNQIWGHLERRLATYHDIEDEVLELRARNAHLEHALSQAHGVAQALERLAELADERTFARNYPARLAEVEAALDNLRWFADKQHELACEAEAKLAELEGKLDQAEYDEWNQWKAAYLRRQEGIKQYAAESDLKRQEGQ